MMNQKNKKRQKNEIKVMEKAVHKSNPKKSQAGKIMPPSVFRPTDTIEKSETPETPKTKK